MTLPRLILASRSPRRASLLAEAGFPFLQIVPPFADPPQPGHAPPHELARELARQKALSVWEARPTFLQPGDVIVAADTIVVAPDGALLGQPADVDDARAMLQKLWGREHAVVTGLALLPVTRAGGIGLTKIDSDQTQVVFPSVSLPWQEQYLAAGHWRGKAGAYNLAELTELEIQVRGDPTNVVGLPMRLLQRMMQT